MKHMILPDGNYAMGKFVPEGSTIVPEKPNGPYSWDGTQWAFDGYTEEDAMHRLRTTRNSLLSLTDWWVLPDRTPTQAQLDYRKALRDLPANSTPALDENGQLTGVEWPVKPE